MAVRAHEGIYQIHWCIHAMLGILPLSLTDRASAEAASEIVDKALKAPVMDNKALKELLRDKLALSESFSWEK